MSDGRRGPSRSAVAIGALAAIAGILVIVAGVNLFRPTTPESSAGPSSGPTGEPAVQAPLVPIAGLPRVQRAVVVRRAEGHEAPGGASDGTVLADLPFEQGQEVVILGDPVLVAGVEWLKVYVLAYGSGSGPDDFFTWIPAEVDGQAQLANIADVACPARRDDLAAMAALDPFSRVRCLGSGSFTFTGKTWGIQVPVWYRVDPSFLGGFNEPGVPAFSLHAGEIQRNFSPGDAQRFLDIQVPAGLEAPSNDIVVTVTAHVADAAAEGCVRRDEADMLPAERPDDSTLWCMTRIVVEHWTADLGPEGRPFDPANPQLHRYDPGPGNACAGVGLPMLRFRIDPAAIDPVWLEAVERPGFDRIVPFFGPAFRPAFRPDLVVVDQAGQVVARDGLQVNPDEDLFGHSLCPTGSGVYIR